MPIKETNEATTGAGRLLNHVSVTAPHAPDPNQLPRQPLINSSSSSSSSLHHHPSVTLPLEQAGPMDLDADMIPSSPSADSSPSSSDLDTESTGSFFPDRSTTLGTLMGVSAFGGEQRRGARASPGVERERLPRAAPEEEGRRAGGCRRRRRRRRRGRSLGGSWWRLCRDDTGGPPTSLGEFLDMERQLAGADFLSDGVGGAQEREAATSVAATALFEDGRVRPPQQPAAAAAEERGRWRLQRAAEGSSSSSSSSLARLPVLLTGICSGGAG